MLDLPDKGYLSVRTSKDGAEIVSVAISQKGGIAFAADYRENEYIYSAPPFTEFQIWQSSEEGDLVQASEERHKKHAEISGLFSQFFEKNIGSGKSADEAMRALKRLKADIEKIEKKE